MASPHTHTAALLCIVALWGGVARAGAAGNDAWTKVLMTDAVAKGAVCLDGSPGGYFLRKGSGAGADKWIIFHQVRHPGRERRFEHALGARTR